MRWED